MKSETITKEKLSGSIAEKIDIPHNHSRKVLEKILEIMIKALVRDGQLKISSFGTFMILNKGKRVGRNPKTGELVKVEPKRVPFFKVGKELKEMVDRKK